MIFKKFRDLQTGDRFLVLSAWEVAADTPESIDDSRPNGLWKVYTNKGWVFCDPNETVTVEN